MTIREIAMRQRAEATTRLIKALDVNLAADLVSVYFDDTNQPRGYVAWRKQSPIGADTYGVHYWVQEGERVLLHCGHYNLSLPNALERLADRVAAEG